MIISTQSRKAKGRMFQQRVRDAIIGKYPELTINDVRSTSMGCSGVDIQLSEIAISLFPFAVECKNVTTFRKEYISQAMSHNSDDRLMPILIIKASRKKPVVVMRSWDWQKGCDIELTNFVRSTHVDKISGFTVKNIYKGGDDIPETCGLITYDTDSNSAHYVIVRLSTFIEHCHRWQNKL